MPRGRHADPPHPARLPPRAVALRRPRGRRRWRPALELRRVPRPLRPLVERPAAPRRGTGRPRGLHRPQHPRPARGVLRRAPARRRDRPAQLPPPPRRLGLHGQPLGEPGRSACTPTTSIWSTASGTRCRRSSTSWRSRAAARAGSTTRRCWPERVAGVRPPRRGRERPARDQLHQRDDVEAQGRDDHAPQRVGERRRHCWSITR